MYFDYKAAIILIDFAAYFLRNNEINKKYEEKPSLFIDELNLTFKRCCMKIREIEMYTLLFVEKLGDNGIPIF